MNDAFDEGCKIITSYRNTKNFDENWIASTYALHWIRSIRTNHRARSVLRLATNIQGTGFLFANEIVKNGWNYTGDYYESEPFNRYDAMMADFAAVVRWDKANDYSYEYELQLHRILLAACGFDVDYK